MTETFEPYGVCMHCGTPVNEFAFDEEGGNYCPFDSHDFDFDTLHDFDSEFPMGVFEDGTPV